MIDGLCDDRGRIGVLAIDHRDSLRAVMAPHDPASIDRRQIVELKRSIIRELAGLATGVMLEPEYSIPDLVDELPAGVGFTAALESQGYSADPTTVPVEVLSGWGPAQAKAGGASAAKLLAYYSDSDPAHAAAQRTTIESVVRDCRRAELPLLLEPLAFPGEPVGPGTLRAVEATLPLGAHVMKVAWPGDDHIDDLVALLGDRPWVLLSGGGPFELYLEQVERGVDLGASGFMAGRAVWREVTEVEPEDRIDALRSVAAPRLRQLRAALS